MHLISRSSIGNEKSKSIDKESVKMELLTVFHTMDLLFQQEESELVNEDVQTYFHSSFCNPYS